MGQTTTHTSRGLLQVQPDGTLGKALPFTSLATRTLSMMWLEWTLEGRLPLFVSARHSHSHSQQSEGLTDLLGLVAED
jgi:hypothetical protein